MNGLIRIRPASHDTRPAILSPIAAKNASLPWRWGEVRTKGSGLIMVGSAAVGARTYAECRSLAVALAVGLGLGLGLSHGVDVSTPVRPA